VGIMAHHFCLPARKPPQQHNLHCSWLAALCAKVQGKSKGKGGKCGGMHSRTMEAAVSRSLSTRRSSAMTTTSSCHAVCVSSQAYSVCVCARPQCVPRQSGQSPRVGPDALQQNTPMLWVVVCAGGARGVLRSCHFRLARWQHCSKPMPRSAWAVHAHVSEGCVVGDSTCLAGVHENKNLSNYPLTIVRFYCVLWCG
jgi:hypothetical protein